jgi:hypothetical protein
MAGVLPAHHARKIIISPKSKSAVALQKISDFTIENECEME